MKIGLIDVDSHNFPNLPLMKISAYHIRKEDTVEFVKENSWYDKVYMSKIFTESKEPCINFIAGEIIRGGSGYDLQNKLPQEIEHQYPDYNLYPALTKGTAFGWLTRGCPRCNHTFCITPKKDGTQSKKVADIQEFWAGQKRIKLLDQNILACPEKEILLKQLSKTQASIEFNGGLDIRFLDNNILDLLREIKVKNYHFAWDDPKEALINKFKMFKEANITDTNNVGVYVLVNYWSTHFEDLYRIYSLRALGYVPFVMIYDKQKFVDDGGRFLKNLVFSAKKIKHFKVCQHMQRWCNSRQIIKSCPNFEEYEPYKKWKKGLTDDIIY